MSIVLFMIVEAGCVLKRLPQPPSEQLRAKLGTIGVVSVRFVPEVEMLTPAKGWARGTVRGAAGAESKLIDATCQGEELGGIICLAATPFAIFGGGINGAVKAPPAAEVEEAQEKLNKAVPANIEIQETMQTQFLQVAREQTHYAFVVLKDRGLVTFDEELSYESLADHGFDTVLEIGLLNFGLKGDWREVNPLLTFFMTLRTRLIRLADGEVVYAATLRYESVKNHTFDVWAANEGQLFKEEFSPCYSTLAEKIVEEVFLLYLP